MRLEKNFVLILLIFMFVFFPCDAKKRPHHRRKRKEKTNTPIIKDANNLKVFNKSVGLPHEHATHPPHREIFSQWSPWSKCNRRCREIRSRQCILTSECGASIVREERKCVKAKERERCEKKAVANRGKVREREVLEKETEEFDSFESEFRVFFHLQSYFSEWSPWTPCSRSCTTYRIRNCQVEKICGSKVLHEDALCYIDGSACEKLYNKRRRHRKKSSATNGNSKEVHPFNGLKCGVAQNFPVRSFLRIIGGKQAAKGSWPWTITILNDLRKPFCGGTLISHQWVLTAAHCIRIRRKLTVRIGEYDLVEHEGSEQESRVLQAFVHPDYDADTVNSDIALLQLKNAFKLNCFAQPACLPEAGDDLPIEAMATILGWGKHKNTALYGSDILHEAVVPIVDTQKCKEVYENYEISETMLCAGYAKGKVDSCAGDSGGPLLFQKDGKWVLYGITSFGDGCGKKGKYGIYAKVSVFTKWIRKTISRYS